MATSRYDRRRFVSEFDDIRDQLQPRSVTVSRRCDEDDDIPTGGGSFFSQSISVLSEVAARRGR